MSAPLAPDDVVATQAAASANARPPLVVMEPLLAFLAQHDLAGGDEPALIGAPFYVMERVRGEVVTSSVPAALDTPAQRRRIGEELVDALVEVHAVDWRAAGLDGFSNRPEGYLERQLRRFLGLWEHNRTREIAAVERVA